MAAALATLVYAALVAWLSTKLHNSRRQAAYWESRYKILEAEVRKLAEEPK